MQQLLKRSFALLSLAVFNTATLAQTPASLPKVEVIGTSPLPGLGQPRNEIAAPVQSAKSRDIEASGALDLSDFMNRRLGSVHVNEMQGNPYQFDINYRGYTASPLLGTPQGLSVYMDGVRMNQPFGDVVSWDLIPRGAISTLTLMPGSNPLFGLNTLGGALSVQTKNGHSDRGTSLSLSAGSNQRRAVEFEHGGANDTGLNWYLNANLFAERGWRDDSPSDVRQLFGKLGWQNDATRVSLTLAHADNQLNGNGLQEQSMLARDRASVYTKPDETRNRSSLLNLAASHSFNDWLQLSGNLYYRKIDSSTLNGDINEAALSQSVYQPSAADQDALTAALFTGFPPADANASNTPFPFWRCIAQGLQNDEPAQTCNGLINRTQTAQLNYGFSGQLSSTGLLWGHRNQWMLGGAFDASQVDFAQSTQLGYLNADRSITGIASFGDAVTGGVVDGVPFDTRVNLSGRSQTWSVFGSDTLSLLGDTLHLTLAGRFNATRIENRDLIHADGDPASLSGDHRFERFNPALGITYSPISASPRALNLYAGYSESSRAPTAVELGCANPEQPCKLPNAMAGDPPLSQVVTRTLELGLRGNTAGGIQWNAGVFHAENQDDILFVADNQAGFGYFKNFGKTRRQGLELGLSTQFSTKLGAFNVGAQYTWLDATYQSAETVNGSSNSSNSSNSSAADGAPGLDGTISIRPGDRIPLVPDQMLKVFADYSPSSNFTVGASMIAVAGALARGNENAAHQPDGTFYQGAGQAAGYAVFNVSANYRITSQWQWTAQINNLFDTRYNTAAQLGANGFDTNGNYQARPFGGSGAAGYPLQHSTFYAPGAPRAVSVALKYVFR
jgi:outer membrane receptor protein involved in Fe transport